MAYGGRDVTPSERAAMVAYQLAIGRRVDTKTVALMGQCSRRTAQRLLGNLSRVLPLTEDDGIWTLMQTKE